MVNGLKTDELRRALFQTWCGAYVQPPPCQEAVQLVGADPAYATLMAPTLQECAAHGIFTQQQALEYCGSKVGSR